MSEDITRLSLAEALEGDRTDWARLSAMTDDAIDTAIAADPDSFAMRESATYQVDRDASGYRWRLIGSDGAVLAVAAQSFRTRREALAAIAVLRATMRGARTAA